MEIYSRYLAAYWEAGSVSSRAASEGGMDNASPRTPDEFAACALATLDWRNGHEPRARAALDVKITAMCAGAEKPEAARVNVGNVDLTELKADVDRLIEATGAFNAPKSGTVEGTTVAVSGFVGFTPSPADPNGKVSGGRVEERVDHKRAAAQRARDGGRAFLADQIPPVSRTGPGAEQVVAGLVLALDDLLGP